MEKIMSELSRASLLSIGKNRHKSIQHEYNIFHYISEFHETGSHRVTPFATGECVDFNVPFNI